MNRTAQDLIRLAFWRTAFCIEKKRRGVKYFHVPIAQDAAPELSGDVPTSVLLKP
jgi:hypothetical protein